MKNSTKDSKIANTDKSNTSQTNSEPKTEEKFITIDMPEVKDIPGQEHIRVPRMKEMEDVTISSADEEGVGIVDSLNREDYEEDDLDLLSDDSSSDMTEQERKTLSPTAAFHNNSERRDLENMALDSTDEDGEALNEASQNQDRFGGDLDVPGAELDNEDEDRGEEDEENNTYSRPN